MRSELRVADVTRTTIEVPFRDAPAPHMERMLPDWKYFEIWRVELTGGATGYGETMLFYPWEETTEEDIERVTDKVATATMWNDDIGGGLQMALFDAVGRTLEVPAAQLLGGALRESVPVSWWCVDMAADDWADEVSEAVRRGYDAMKVKARPWWDLPKAVAAVDEVIPDSFHLGLDFNKTLVDADRAIPVLKALEAAGSVDTFEEPIDRNDTVGYDRIREETDASIAHHFSYNDPLDSLAADVADQFVKTDGASSLRGTASTLATVEKPMWYQLVGTGITAAWGLHLGATLDVELLPSINCHEVFDESLLCEEIVVSNGRIPVPEGSGLGYTVDEAAIDRLAIDMKDVDPNPERLIAVDYDTEGETYYFATGRQLRAYAQAGNLPSYDRHVRTRVVPNDDSTWWRKTRARVEDEPILED